MRVFAWIIIQIACALLSTPTGKCHRSETGDQRTGAAHPDPRSPSQDGGVLLLAASFLALGAPQVSLAQVISHPSLSW